MTRPLLITAACGYIVALVCFAAAYSLGGFSAPWHWHGGDWSWDWDDRRGPPAFGGGPETTRTLTWSGGNELTVNIPAEVTYVQGVAPQLTVTGPRGTVERVVIEDGRLKFDRRVRRPGRIQVQLTAPDVEQFILNGSQRLHVQGFDRDRLEVRVAGSGDVVAQGKARTVELTIAGSGDIDLAGMAADEAEVNILGSGDATIGPRDRAEINIAGSGEVTLTTRPARVETKIGGSGRVIQAEPAPAAPTPPAKAS